MFTTYSTGIVTQSYHTAKYKAARTWNSKKHKKNEAYEYAGILQDFCVIPRKGRDSVRKYQRALGILLACNDPIEMNRKFINMRDGTLKL